MNPWCSTISSRIISRSSGSGSCSSTVRCCSFPMSHCMSSSRRARSSCNCLRCSSSLSCLWRAQDATSSHLDWIIVIQCLITWTASGWHFLSISWARSIVKSLSFSFSFNSIMNLACSAICLFTSSSSSGNGPANLSFISASLSHSSNILTDLWSSSACLSASSSLFVLFLLRSQTFSHLFVSSVTCDLILIASSFSAVLRSSSAVCFSCSTCSVLLLSSSSKFLCCSTSPITVSKSPCTGCLSSRAFSILASQSMRALRASLNCPENRRASSSFLCLSTERLQRLFHLFFSSVIMFLMVGSSVFGALPIRPLPVFIVESYIGCFSPSSFWNSLCLIICCLIFSGSFFTSFDISSRRIIPSSNHPIMKSQASWNSFASLYP